MGVLCAGLCAAWALFRDTSVPRDSLLWQRLWVWIHFGSVRCILKTSLCKLPATKPVLSCSVLPLRWCCVLPGWGWYPGKCQGCPCLVLGDRSLSHVCTVCESSWLKTPQGEQGNKSFSKIAWDKDLENLLFVSFKSPQRLLLLREEMLLSRSSLFFFFFPPDFKGSQLRAS